MKILDQYTEDNKLIVRVSLHDENIIKDLKLAFSSRKETKECKTINVPHLIVWDNDPNIKEE